MGKLKYNFDSLNGGHSDWVSSLVYLDNGYLASGSYDRTVKNMGYKKRSIKIHF